MEKKLRIGALISGSGTNLQAIIDACESGRLKADVVFVGSDNPDAYGLERAKRHGIPTFIVDYRKIVKAYKDRLSQDTIPKDFNLEEVLARQSIFPADRSRAELAKYFTLRAIAEAELLRNMASFSFDLLVLAGFMRKLSPYFIDRVNIEPGRPRIMNIHPALLPSFPGVDGYGDTYRYGCKVGGCTVHFVDYGEDSGPIIGQKAFEITPHDTIETIKEKGLRLEWQLYVDCIRLFAEDRLRVVQKTYTTEGDRKTKRAVVEVLPPTNRS
nr:phosphoribosylglycinamide formyltransferase [Desulfobacterales bacterium]